METCTLNYASVLTIGTFYFRCSELWCGQSKGKMSVWNLSSVSGNLKSVSHADINGDVFLLATRPKNAKALWSYVYPGIVVRYFHGSGL